MTDQPANAHGHLVHDNSHIDIEREPGLVDAIRFLYQRRIRLTIYFLAMLAVGILAFLLWYFTAAKSVEGTLSLNFRGIEKSEYPNGKRFNVEDFRGPDALLKALAISGIAAENAQLQELAAHLNVTPVIPAEIQARWRKADRDATKREEYYPNEFRIGIDLPRLTNAQKFRLFDAVVQSYQERVKKEQKSAIASVATWDASYEKLADIYDTWDIPDLFRESYDLLDQRLSDLITEATESQDPRFQLSFREIEKELATWYRTRLQALEALTYQGQLVRNRDMVMQRIQYRSQYLDIRIRQQTLEASEAMRLLEVIDRPKAFLAGQLGNKEGLPMIDANVLERLIKSDYVGPVVQRISKIQKEIQEMQTEKAQLEKQLSLLPKSSNAGQPPQGYKELLIALSSELNSIIKNYNRFLDEYLTVTITNLVVIKQSPIIVTGNDYARLILAGIVFGSLFLALIVIGVERLLERANKPQI